MKKKKTFLKTMFHLVIVRFIIQNFYISLLDYGVVRVLKKTFKLYSISHMYLSKILTCVKLNLTIHIYRVRFRSSINLESVLNQIFYLV